MTPKKARGRKQARPVKDLILALLRERVMTAREIADIIGITRNCTSMHMRWLESNGEVYRVPGSAPIVYSLEKVAGDSPHIEPIDDGLLMKQAVIPFGQWKASIPPVRSVFDLGAA